MRALIPSSQSTDGLATIPETIPDHLAHEVEDAKALIRARHAESTRRAYASDVMDFRGWCTANGLSPFPARPESVVLYLTMLAKAGKAPNTLQRRLAAIRHLHREAGHPSPTDSDAVAATLAGIRRTVGSSTRQAAPATGDRIRDMLNTCTGGLVATRDRALLSLGFGGALRRSEIVSLDVEDVEFQESGVRIRLRKSKTDQIGSGQTVAILDGPRLRVTEALQAWIQSAGIESGPLFRSLSKGNKVTGKRLTDRAVSEIVKRRAAAAGLDSSAFSGHSLRAGFLTSAAMAGASVWKMAEVSRHKKIETLALYVRQAQAFDNHAGSAFM